MEELREHLEQVEERHAELEKKLADPEVIQQRERFAELSKEYSDLDEVVNALHEYEDLQEELEMSREDLEDTEDEELKEMLESDITRLEGEIEELEARIQRLLLPSDPTDEKDAILEIRSGTGGDEAALFASELLRMYLRYAELRGWSTEIVDEEDTGMGGLRTAVVKLSDDDVYGELKYESGVHRVQRIPETESGDRIHTSTVTVAVLPEAEDVEIEIDENDLRIDTYRASGAGGQHVNKTASAVRITHEPTDTVVQCQQERSQHQNKDKAMEILRAKLYQRKQEEKREERESLRRSQVGSGERSEKVRTYNFPQNRITDHRIDYTSHHLDKILDGELDELLEALKTYDETQKLAELAEKDGASV